MTSEVDICNIALSNIRAGSINSLDEGSLQSTLCKLKYSLMRDRLLTEVLWPFNTVLEPLTLLTDEIFTWSQVYQYPVSCLKIDRLVGEYEELQYGEASVISRLVDSQVLPINSRQRKIPYKVFNIKGNKVIGANEANLRIIYSTQITNPDLFSTDFILALSHLLSSELAIPIVGAEMGRVLRSDSLTLYKGYIDSAVADGLNEQYEEPLLSELETIRR